MNAAPDRTAVIRQAKDEQRKRLERAMADVMEEGHGLHAAAKNRGVPEGALRKMLHERGWVAPHFRGRSRASSPPLTLRRTGVQLPCLACLAPRIHLHDSTPLGVRRPSHVCKRETGRCRFMGHPIRIPSAKHASRPMHFVDGWAGVTVCNKEVSRVRTSYSLKNWDNPLLAAGSRCAACESWVTRTYPDRIVSRRAEEG